MNMVCVKTSHVMFKHYLCPFLECKEGWFEMVLGGVVAKLKLFKIATAFHKTRN